MIRAQAQHRGRRPELVLTHPEDWSPQQITVLLDAANALGHPRHLVSTISEPQAAAQYFALTNPIATGEKIAVFDFGGGSLDVAVLSASSEGTFQVLAASSDNTLGGAIWMSPSATGWDSDSTSAFRPSGRQCGKRRRRT